MEIRDLRSPTIDSRTRRRLQQNLTKEARWLQKATFALDKAKEARSRVGDIVEDGLDPIVSGDETMPIEDLNEHITRRVEEIRDQLGAGRYRSL